MLLKNRGTKSTKDLTGPAPSTLFTEAHQKYSQWKGGSRETILKEGNREKRHRHAKLHKNCSKNQWQEVLWSDESKCKVFASKSSSASIEEVRSEVSAYSLCKTRGFVASFQQLLFCTEKCCEILIQHEIPFGKFLGTAFVLASQ